jgi:hypothetical protein
MNGRSLRSILTAAVAAAAAGAGVPPTITPLAVTPASAQAQARVQDLALRTPWGEPDLQGIWTDESDTPLQRSPKFANQEFFTEAQRAELDRDRAALMRRDKRVTRGTELDVAGAYNALFFVQKPTGVRTSMIMDPPNGRFPPLTPEAQKMAAAERDFRLALLQSTETCKSANPVGCGGGKYDPTPSPRFADPPPRYNVGRINRHEGPEDSSLGDRCLTAGLPEFGSAAGSFRRIVQTPGGVSIFYDVSQGQGWQRNIVMDGSSHLPKSVRQWYGDSRGHWEGNTLVIDVTNFSAKTDFQGSRDNLHVVERWTRTGPNSLEYVATIDDPTVWTKAWTAKQEFTRQSEQENRVYYEPRCFEGNYGLPGLMRGARAEELAFAEGRGPHPATKDNATDFVGVEDDPLQ